MQTIFLGLLYFCHDNILSVNYDIVLIMCYDICSRFVLVINKTSII